MKRLFLLILVSLITLAFFSCSDGGDDKNEGGNSAIDNISWSNESAGTLKVQNDTDKDVVLFQGQTPSVSNILGGVRANSSRTFDISDDVDDFDTGGYMILRGISKSEYEKNQQDFSVAKIEYSAMVTYGSGKKFSVEINPRCFGDYYYKLANTGRIGIELRRDSPDGEKIGYLPSYTNYTFYADSGEAITIFPVYVYYNKSTGEVFAIKSDNSDSITVAPRHVSDSSGITINFSAPDDILDKISSL